MSSPKSLQRPDTDTPNSNPSTSTSTGTSVNSISKTGARPSTSTRYNDEHEPPCSLFSITQFQCSPWGGQVTCWPLERVFRQCGKDKPVMEVTNRLVPSMSSSPSSSIRNRGEGPEMMVDPGFLQNPPKARTWADVHRS